jgi:hypothetical protein
MRVDRSVDLTHVRRNVEGPAIERHQRRTRRQIPSSRLIQLCTVCGVVTSRSAGRCGEHPRLSGIGAHPPRPCRCTMGLWSMPGSTEQLFWRARQDSNLRIPPFSCGSRSRRGRGECWSTRPLRASAPPCRRQRPTCVTPTGEAPVVDQPSGCSGAAAAEVRPLLKAKRHAEVGAGRVNVWSGAMASTVAGDRLSDNADGCRGVPTPAEA